MAVDGVPLPFAATSERMAVAGVPRGEPFFAPVPCREDFASMAERQFATAERHLAAEIGVMRGVFAEHNLKGGDRRPRWRGRYVGIDVWGSKKRICTQMARLP